MDHLNFILELGYQKSTELWCYSQTLKVSIKVKAKYC
jgi:hypothetical protein